MVNGTEMYNTELTTGCFIWVITTIIETISKIIEGSTNAIRTLELW